MKLISKIILFIIVSINFIYATNFVNALDPIKTIDDNQDVWTQKQSNKIENPHLEEIKNTETDFITSDSWWESIYDTLINIAKSMKNAFFYIATIYFFVLVIKLIFSDNTDEQVWKFKKWILWISIWLIITQISYSFVQVLYSKWVWETLAYDFSKTIIQPLIKLLETWASFVFIAVAIIAFFKLVTANWDDWKVKNSKMSIFYSIIWFIVIKVSWIIVNTIYWKISCDDNILSIFKTDNCTRTTDLSWFAQTVVNIINWVNWFLWILVIILIIYAWLQVIFNLWDEDRLKKAKKAILFIIIWLFLLVVNYLVLTFFLVKENPTLIN